MSGCGNDWRSPPLCAPVTPCPSGYCGVCESCCVFLSVSLGFCVSESIASVLFPGSVQRTHLTSVPFPSPEPPLLPSYHQLLQPHSTVEICQRARMAKRVLISSWGSHWGLLDTGQNPEQFEPASSA